MINAIFQPLVFRFYKFLLRTSARALLNIADRNKDGVIDSEEIEAIFEKILKQANGHFKKIKLVKIRKKK